MSYSPLLIKSPHDKLDFIILYPTAYTEALTASNIDNGFPATGLVLFNLS